MSRRVLLLIESTRAYGRGCLRGIAAYARAHGPWTFLHVERGLEERLPRWISRCQGDGVIARIENQSQTRALRRLGLPIVDLRGRFELRGIPSFNTDPRAVARLAAEHFLQRGFRHIAFCGFDGIDFSDQRRDALREHLRRQGVELLAYRSPHASHETVRTESAGELTERQLGRWLASLPGPAGVLACNDVRARQVVVAARQRGLRVPDDLAVLGVDNDPVICDLSTPPLSSIEPDTRRLGFLGAAMLDRMMRGESAAEGLTTVPPLRVVTRLSSDILKVDEPTVAQALEIIRRRACDGLTVERLLDEMTVSRSTLERRFLASIGRTPRDEMARLRLERIRTLLLETDYAADKIARMCGFTSASHLSVFFKQQTGRTPGEFRQERV